MAEKKATREGFGAALAELGEKYDFYVLDADLAAATKTGMFKKKFPERFIDCGIAEGNMIGLRDSYCVAGIDLSQTRDLTAAVVIVEKNGELYVLAKFWLPRERIQEAIRTDGLPYDIYIQRGLLEPSGENFIDYEDCYRWLTELVEKYQILPLKTGYDRYSSQYLVQSLKNYGFHTDDVFQGDNLYPMIQEWEGLMMDGKVHIGDNDLLKVHMLNAAIKMSVERGRGKLVKINPSAHIDGMAAILDAMTMRSKYAEEIGDQLRNEG